MDYIKVKCSNCGKRLYKYYTVEWRYGSPVKVCKKCGKKYVDRRYHEIAVDGISKDTFSKAKGPIYVIFGGLILYRGIYLSGMHMLNTPENSQWVFPTVLILLGAVLAIIGIVDFISVISGKKAKKLEKLRQESEDRMEDRNYAQLLKNFGYPVPDKYL